MNWKLLLDYLKFFAGIGLITYAHFFKPEYYELIVIIGGLILTTTRINIKFSPKFI